MRAVSITEGIDAPGTISIDAHTISDYSAQIGSSVAHHGFRHSVLVNGHGRNVPFLDVAARLITNCTAAICAMVSWWSLLTPEDLSWRYSAFPGGMVHACEAKTARVLHIAPEAVDLSKAERTMDRETASF